MPIVTPLNILPVTLTLWFQVTPFFWLSDTYCLRAVNTALTAAHHSLCPGLKVRDYIKLGKHDHIWSKYEGIYVREM